MNATETSLDFNTPKQKIRATTLNIHGTPKPKCSLPWETAEN